MNATITSLGGRAPPGRKTPTLCAGSRSRVAVRSFHAGAASAPRAHWWSGRAAGRHPVRPGAPSDATIPYGSPVSRRPIESSPTATDARRRAQTPFGPRAHSPPGNTCSVVPWAPSSLGKSPPKNPARFSLLNTSICPVSITRLTSFSLLGTGWTAIKTVAPALPDQKAKTANTVFAAGQWTCAITE